MNTRCHTFGTLLLARHVETQWNRSGRIMGQWDSQITVEGLARIRVLADILKSQGIDRIVSSPLGRAALTASVYSQTLSVPLHFNPKLSELSAGVWQGQLRIEVSQQGARLFRSTWYDRPPNGESYADAEDRIGIFLNEISSYREEAILIIGHAGINRVILKMRLNLKPSDAVKLLFPHDATYRIDSSDRAVLVDPKNAEGRIISL